ncbi:hypothetical protein L2E82_20838 [Cichorium intybus]|uniref:Uncharacterized protein n=1 Tax=Cichorium intybus TaxID=13427 RepID=A0ACB9DU46_CICIN|nr:hypothetical protein L2E82_20838 [Cichorium intybus]
MADSPFPFPPHKKTRKRSKVLISDLDEGSTNSEENENGEGGGWRWRSDYVSSGGGSRDIRESEDDGEEQLISFRDIRGWFAVAVGEDGVVGSNREISFRAGDTGGGRDGSSDGMKECIGEEAAPGNGVAGEVASLELWAARGRRDAPDDREQRVQCLTF